MTPTDTDIPAYNRDTPRHMLVACRDADAVQIFAVDPHSGVLTDTGRQIDVPRPVCVRFIQ